ncbi:hypothetical protein ACFQ9J_16675 [Streptomyces sp. NPDC056529]|uniref:hypothetical protein n=1 Tax=Streptomyces sp. NPDC056529 TaxID=3345855 RepID=UPI0036BA377E
MRQQRHRSRAETPYEQALRTQVVRLYGSGTPQQRVAATLGISVEAVVARLEPSRRRSRQEATRLAVDQQGELLPQKEIITRYVQGATVVELGRLYEVHPSMIRRRIPDDLIRSRGRAPRPAPRSPFPGLGLGGCWSMRRSAAGRRRGERLRARPRVRRLHPHDPGADP